MNVVTRIAATLAIVVVLAVLQMPAWTLFAPSIVSGATGGYLIGFIIASIKDIHGAPVGDTLTLSSTPEVEVLPGFKKIQPQVYAGLFPVSSDDFEDFRDAR